MRFCALAIGALALLPHVGAAEKARPNILWIIAEDFGPELSCYGHPQVWTPHLDRLAADGVRYTRAFTVAPVCSTSRSSFMTGMYACSINAHNHRSFRGRGGGVDQGTNPLPDGVRLITHWLRDAGYFTANIRQLSDDPKERFYRGTGKTDWNFQHEGKAFDSDRWADLKGHQPFYAQVNFPETHRGGAWDNAHRNIERTADPEKVRLPPYYPDHPTARKDWAQYLNTAMALDRKVGYVLERLERDGLARNTVVIFFGDHGRAMVRGKQWPYDSGLHIPMILRWPKEIPAPKGLVPGTVDGRLVSAIDIPATTLAIAGLPKPPTMQGRIFLGPDADPPRRYAFGMRDRGDETVFRVRTVRDARYRYLRNFHPERPFLQINRYKEYQYPVITLLRYLDEKGRLTGPPKALLAPSRPPEELYDLDRDPYEIHNLIDDDDHRKIADRLREVLDRWIVDVDDKGRVPEDPAIVEYWEKQMIRAYESASRSLEKRQAEFRRMIQEDERAAGLR